MQILISFCRHVSTLTNARRAEQPARSAATTRWAPSAARARWDTRSPPTVSTAGISTSVQRKSHLAHTTARILLDPTCASVLTVSVYLDDRSLCFQDQLIPLSQHYSYVYALFVVNALWIYVYGTHNSSNLFVQTPLLLVHMLPMYLPVSLFR